MTTLERFVIICAAVIALTVSLVTALYPNVCSTCLVASILVRSVSFSWLGLFFYGALIVAASITRFGRFVRPMLCFAAGTHAVLLLMLYQGGWVCWLCIAAGISIGFAFLFTLFKHRTEWIEMILCVAIGVVTSKVIISAGGLYDRHLRKQAVELVAKDAMIKFTATPNTAYMIVYLRPGCHFCELFVNEDIPKIRTEFGNQVVISFREPLENLPSPAVVVLPGVPMVFTGRPNFKELLAALIAARDFRDATHNSVDTKTTDGPDSRH